MTSPNLENLANSCQLKREPGDSREFDWRFVTRDAMEGNTREGLLDVDEQLVKDLIEAAVVLETKVGEMKGLT